jgi:hypothetical protein
MMSLSCKRRVPAVPVGPDPGAEFREGSPDRVDLRARDLGIPPTRCAPAFGNPVPPTRWRAQSGWLASRPSTCSETKRQSSACIRRVVGRRLPRSGGTAAFSPSSQSRQDRPAAPGWAPCTTCGSWREVTDRTMLRRSAHGERVGEPDLAGLVDHEGVARPRELRPAEQEGGAADDVGIAERSPP